MSLSLTESKAIGDIARLLYDFLPGSGNPTWRGHVSFQTVASKVGVGEFWVGGSKLPALTGLLERTFEHRKTRFEALILEIVHQGLSYRKRSGKSINCEEVDLLNGYLLQLGFKFPDLWKPEFRASLEPGYDDRIRKQTQQSSQDSRRRQERSVRLASLREVLTLVQTEPDRSMAGYHFQKLLTDLFGIFDLSPRKPFRVVGEEIDGSFELDHETYLLEAKAGRDPVSAQPLQVFRTKIMDNSPYTRGVFVALNGLSTPASDRIHSVSRNFFVVNGHDLMMILSEAVGLEEFLRQRQRLLAEEGLVVVGFNDLWSGSRRR